MPFNPDSTPPETLPTLEESSGEIWTPLYTHACSFPPEIFREVMLNLIRNPNINSNHLFRADISLDCPFEDGVIPEANIPPRITQFKGFTLKSIMVRTMIPRNVLVDKPLDQTCNFYHQVNEDGDILSLVIYLPHISLASESPFYHPAVHGIAFLHTFNPKTQQGIVAIHYSFFDSEPRSVKLERTALHLLSVLHKHGQGSVAGYVKRVQHDVILPQARVQNTYARLKTKYARDLVLRWVESTDPGKHVFEDLSIAAFLIELWAEMYEDKAFPGFVDIGCGNGLLVHILLEEGYSGWGFDARRRKSWQSWSPKAQGNLKELVLIPSIIQSAPSSTTKHGSTVQNISNSSSGLQLPDIQDLSVCKTEDAQATGTHDGIFPKGTFIISNHADELTPWTPLLANISECPFMMISCCSHSLSGSRFRAPPPKDGSSRSAYASLVVWVSKLAKDCGWEVEKEMLRIPSTRNTALIGRRRMLPFDEVDVVDLVFENGGAAGWEENALKLVKGSARGH
ncbi:tRNA(Ser) Um(44) 2'-O-methyltransferase [Cadophora gregata]|uniref:tRNA(Ser) Um(44) 2'-O-methyltransferase n=1 Tax=Cadophora gregata TaxID=51156 RepID=UPI0026DCEBE9|nr:tRNA(Ser) Um(44) 2'-O-methyltransferase [Cadophora gregata]KAK0109684.1 tRNA(Ser) Um(44) 2'-O-methyltransferase [Cadophora gregata]